ncbi:transposase [Pseudomonas aeruginosa]
MARLHPEKIAGDQGQHHHLPLQPNRLHYLYAESEVLPQHAESENRPQHPRGCPRRGQTHRQDTGIPRLRCERKKVEMLFAHLKRIMKLDRLRLRGLTGATDEFTLAATVQNLRRMAKLLPHGPPTTG